jgi:hybrid cluster-associated redox disulfide protein
MTEENKKEIEKFEATIDSNIMETVEKIPGAAEIFAEYGLPCAGCAAASYEKISDIIGEFGVDGDEFVAMLNNSKA